MAGVFNFNAVKDFYHFFSTFYYIGKYRLFLAFGHVIGNTYFSRHHHPHRCHFVVSLSKNVNPSLVLVQPRKTRPFITERLLMGRNESNQTNKKKRHHHQHVANDNYMSFL